MMRNKLYLLLAILFLVVICATAADEKVRKTDNAKNSKKKTVTENVVTLTDNDEHDREEDDDNEIDDSYSPRSSFAHNRFLSFDPAENSYRTRSRWPTTSEAGFAQSSPALPFTIDAFPHDNEWLTSDYESSYASPFSTTSYDTQRMSSNGQTCTSLIDPQYPIFSDTCGAVPQARYSLPNAFGHRDKWQVAQLLNVLASTETDPTCTRSTRLLLCPILFPSCPTRHQPSPVLPCQAYCRAVKARCASPLLENLPCEILPHSSEFCPTNQGYGSLVPPRNFAHNRQQSLPMTGGHPSSRQFSTLQSLLSSPAFQAALSGQSFPTGFNPQTLQNGFGAQAFPSPFQVQNLQPAVMPAPTPAPAPVATPPPPPQHPVTPAPTPMNLYNNLQFPVDTISAMLGELPTHSYGNEYRQGSRYGSGARSTNDFRGSSNTRPSGASTMIRA